MMIIIAFFLNAAFKVVKQSHNINWKCNNNDFLNLRLQVEHLKVYFLMRVPV
jgi:hypothetical protein